LSLSQAFFSKCSSRNVIFVENIFKFVFVFSFSSADQEEFDRI
jgi:hypothetical protein